MLLREQGYEIANNVIFQDNKSAILIEKMGEIPVQGTLAILILDIFCER